MRTLVDERHDAGTFLVPWDGTDTHGTRSASGTYLFRLPPGEAIINCFKEEPTADQGQRLTAIFQDESALWNETLNQPYSGRVSNRVRYINVNDRDNPGEKKKVGISDMAQLLRVVDFIPEAKTNQGYGSALIKAGGRRFKGEHTLTATCNSARTVLLEGVSAMGSDWNRVGPSGAARARRGRRLQITGGGGVTGHLSSVCGIPTPGLDASHTPASPESSSPLRVIPLRGLFDQNSP